MITNMSAPFSIEVINDLSSDHLPVLITTTLNSTANNQTVKKTNWLLFHNILYFNNTQQDTINNTTDIDRAIDNYTKDINNAYNDSTLTKIETLNKYKLPKHITDIISIKSKLRKKYQKTLNPAYKSEINKLIKQIKKLCQQYRQENWSEKVSSLCQQDNSIWNMVK